MRMLLLVVLISFFLSLSLAIFSCDDDDDDEDDGHDGGTDDDDESGETWTDPSSNLTWQVTPAEESQSWEEAQLYCDSLSLDGGGWHLPTISELRTLVRGCTETGTDGSCGVLDGCVETTCYNDDCNVCVNGDGPNNGCFGPTELPGECDWFWSSSQVPDYESTAWGIHFSSGYLYNNFKDTENPVRCVR